jgi:hypothetical protein
MRCKSGLGQKRKSEHLALFSTLIFQQQKFECDPNKSASGHWRHSVEQRKLHPFSPTANIQRVA